MPEAATPPVDGSVKDQAKERLVQKVKDADEAKQKAAVEGAAAESPTKPQEEPTGKVPAGKEEPSGEPPTREDLEEEISYLKGRLGDQSGDVGDQRKKIIELETMVRGLQEKSGVDGPATQNAFEQRFDKFKEVYGEGVANDIAGLVQTIVAPLQAEGVVASLRTKYADFDELGPEIETILQQDNVLAAAVGTDLRMLEYAYQKAKAQTAEKRGAALAEQKGAERRASFSERPTGAPKATEPQEPSRADKQSAWKERLRKSKHRGRSID